MMCLQQTMALPQTISQWQGSFQMKAALPLAKGLGHRQVPYITIFSDLVVSQEWLD